MNTIPQDSKRSIARRTCQSSSRRSGSVVLFVAGLLVVLLGMCALAVDYGRMVATRNQLQRACDAGALAAAAELPASDATRTASATYYAKLTAGQNQVSAAETTVEFLTTTKVQVAAQRQVNFLFAPILGLTSGPVSAKATAGRTKLAAVPVVPLAITTNDYNTYRNGTAFNVRLVDNNRQDFTPGTVTALDLRPGNSGKSGDQFQGDLTDGYPDPVYFDQNINSALNASLNSQGQKVQRALDARFAKAAGSPWNDPGPGYATSKIFPDYVDNNPRVIIIPVSDPNLQDNNNPHITAKLFAAIYVERQYNQAGDTFLTVRIMPSVTFNNNDPNIVVGNDSTTDVGFTIIRLLG